jgi:DNA-binding MarR family transcriptional regulator
MSSPLHEGHTSPFLIDLLIFSYRVQTEFLHRLSAFTLPPLQLLILIFADTLPNRTIRPSQISKTLGLSMSTVSESIRALHKKGFLRRSERVTDGRHKGYRLTAKSRDPLRMSRSEWIRHTKHIVRDSHDSLHQQLAALTESLQLVQRRGRTTRVGERT